MQQICTFNKNADDTSYQSWRRVLVQALALAQSCLRSDSLLSAMKDMPIMR